jgi:hypothetical protein
MFVPWHRLPVCGVQQFRPVAEVFLPCPRGVLVGYPLRARDGRHMPGTVYNDQFGLWQCNNHEVGTLER